jgi:SAM-dependent methyltransferase
MQTESDRIRRAYEERDAAAPAARYGWENPGYVWHIGDLEWQLLSGMRRAGASFTGAQVLEVGCGFGTILQRMVDFGAASGTGVDLSAARVEEARRRYPALDVRVADASELPFEDGSFDVVTQFVCLSSVLDPELRRAICAEMARVTRPGGLIVSYDIRPTPRPIQLAGRAYARLRRADLDRGTPTAPVTLAELRTAFGELDARTVTLNFDLAGVAGRSRTLAHAMALIPPLRTHTLAVARRA